MRMKDICAQTGLTDRAVRLYIENGLLSPKREQRYSGRDSIIFDEEDLRTLEVVATLRRAEFSIADIREMQEHPDTIPALLDLHRQKLGEEIRAKQEVLASLQNPDESDLASPAALARHLRASAPSNKPLKEETHLTLHDIKRIIRSRIPSLLALVAMLGGALTLISLGVKTAFGILTLVPGEGSFSLTYGTPHTLPHVLLSLLPAVLILAALICTFLYLAGGKQGWLWAGLGGSALTILALLLLPMGVREQMYRFEFLAYRFSFMHAIAYRASEGFDFFIRSLKYILPAAGMILAAFGLWRESPNSGTEK